MLYTYVTLCLWSAQWQFHIDSEIIFEMQNASEAKSLNAVFVHVHWGNLKWRSLKWNLMVGDTFNYNYN